ncbi:ABC transporter permease [Actinoplanes derwentensis]|uniref:Peptide/nickel transport system permease protein n=1 Tax=Actinoplanes derwentensis TaxID=113562 RepID=A0A1H1ZTX0_9ACTN|nr:ABC transporter permease [Actinoplanes derwentensis]GID83562.1 peptide ABC transporter permease [Actinoplanes derwentensis]SDT36842.1 peptide/nickel transport system permease protein [Actinoplanes derwentensis]
MTTVAAPPRKAPSRFREIATRTWANPSGKLALSMLALLVLAAVFAPLLAGQDPAVQKLSATNDPPSWLGGIGGHPLGADNLGRDVLSRILHGLRLSLAVGALTATAGAVLGLALGLLAGYYERSVGAVLLRLADIQFSIPFVAVGIALAAVLGPGIGRLMVVLALWGWPIYARTIVTTVAQTCRLDYVTAARTMGAHPFGLLLRHVAPNILGQVIVLWSTTAGALVLAESSLSLLGLGVQPPGFSLGSMLADAPTSLRLSWWATVFPGVALLLIVLAFNMLGDAVRDALEPGTHRAPHDPDLT